MDTNVQVERDRQIRKTIAGYSGLCADGKRFVAQLMAAAVGYVEPPVREPKPLEVWNIGGDILTIHAGDKPDSVHLVNIQNGKKWLDNWRFKNDKSWKDGTYHCVADSLESYLRDLHKNALMVPPVEVQV